MMIKVVFTIVLIVYLLFIKLNYKVKSNKLISFNLIEEPDTKIYKDKTFYNISTFPQLKNINYPVIKNELLYYLNNSNEWIDWPEYELWNNDKVRSSWKVIPLMAFSKWSNKYKNIFPETIKELSKIEGLVNAGFSKLGPNSRLNPHKGWGKLSNHVLRCHLGLIVPENKCKIFVLGKSNDVMYQKENNWIIFDDSLIHCASNDDKTNERIVLILDIKRPGFIPKGKSKEKYTSELDNFINDYFI